MSNENQPMKNLKRSFSDPKVRSIIIIFVIVVLIALIVGYLELRRTLAGENLQTTAQTTAAPAIRSIPGVGTPSRAYIQLQQQQNIEQARKALQQKTAAVPTVIRTTYLGSQLPSATPTSQTPGCSIEELQRARAAGVTAFELRCRGCSAAALKAAGYTAGELRDAGFTAAQLRAAGFTAKQLKAAGFSADDLKSAGFSDQELRAAGFATPTNKIDCSIEALTKAHAAGVSAAQLKECGAAALKAAGYTAKELKDAGFSAGELKAAGFTAKQLKDAGFSAKELRDAGFSADQLKDAGFTANQLKQAGFTDGDLVRAGFAPDKINPPQVIQAPAQVATSTLTPTPSTATATSLQDKLAAIQAQQSQALSAEAWQNEMNQLQQNMAMQADQLFASWTPLPSQQLVVSERKDEAATAMAAAGSAQQGEALAQANVDYVIPAYTPLFASLDTAIDTDSPAPIMATIVSGKLKGAKVAGSFKRSGEGIVLQFTALKVPNLSNALPINAYAIDPATAKTAMSSSVDNHYLARYGSLFAASFLSGVGSAMQSTNSQIAVTPVGIMYSMGNLNPTQQVMVGLGKVGSQFGQILQQKVNEAPTVKLTAGSSIALYLRQAVSVPKYDTKQPIAAANTATVKEKKA